MKSALCIVSFVLQIAIAFGHGEDTASDVVHVPDGYELRWEDSFDGPNISTSNWVIASLRDPLTGITYQMQLWYWA